MEENKIMNEEMKNFEEANVPEVKDDTTYIDLPAEKESEGKDVSTLVIGATVVLTAAAIGGAIWTKNRIQNWWGNRKKKKDSESETVVDADYEEVDEDDGDVYDPEKDPENDEEPSKKK